MTPTIWKAAAVALTLAAPQAAAARDIVVSSKIDTEGGLLGNIILLPLTYRFGYEKAKYVYYLCIGMLGALMGITVSSGGILLNSILPAHSSALVGVVVLAAVLALYALSWRLSVAWYGKAEQ